MASARDPSPLSLVARHVFGLEVETPLAVTDSFSSNVLRFRATNGEQYVLKQPAAPNKAEREANALRALHDHDRVPNLLDYKTVDGDAYLLIEGLHGEPWADIGSAPPSLLHEIGRAVHQVHQQVAPSFAGQPTWRDLLVFNADRYRAAIGRNDAALADRARSLLDAQLDATPQSAEAVLVHFDLRPGNILVNDGRLVGLIDFEACRGGHASMDFFKFWQQVAPLLPQGLAWLMHGYHQVGDADESWMRPDELGRLMQIYSLYHGLAGLSWCYQRNDFSGAFPDVNRGLMGNAAAALSP